MGGSMPKKRNRASMKITVDDLSVVVPNLDEQSQLSMLHIGCGSANPKRLPECFKDGRWTEVKLDIDPAAKPDIVSDVCDMKEVADESYDAVWSSHNLEHIDECHVGKALSEIFRVIRPDGFLLITLPDLSFVAKMVLEGRLHEVLYNSPAGPIRPIDMLFGHQKSIADGNIFMAHRTGFTADSLLNDLEAVGFSKVHVRPGNAYDLWAIAVK